MYLNPRDSELAYERWHSPMPVDDETDTPWHCLVKGHLVPTVDLENKRVLEIGCGRGGFACWLAVQLERPAEIVASDFVQTAIDKGRSFAVERGISGITWQINDIQAIPYSDESFDTIISCETIEHVPQPRRAIAELARVLKPGGRMFLTTPNYLGSLGLYRIYLWLAGRVFVEEGQPINNFMLLPRTVTWVREAGMHISTIDAVGHYLPFPGRPPLRFRGVDRPRRLMKWFALHTLIVAEKGLRLKVDRPCTSDNS